MATEAIYKLEPHRTVSLRGFDRRAADAAITNASASGFTVSGGWGDQADFAVLTLHDADDQFGHLFTTRYLPDFSLAGVTLDFDLAMTGCFSLASRKYEAVPWRHLSYIDAMETPGTVDLLPMATSATGEASASATFTVAGATAPFDRVQLVYLSNYVYEFIVPGGTGSSVTFFYQLNGTTASIGGYTYTVEGPVDPITGIQDPGQSGSDIASALAALAAGDANVQYTASGSSVAFASRVNTGGTMVIAGYTLWLVTAGFVDNYIAARLVTAINATNWVSLGPTTALMATQSGASFTVYAARYGTVNTAGTAVTFASGYNLLGSAVGDPILINGVQYQIAAVTSPASITLTASAGAQTGATYLAPGGGRDGNSIALLEMHLTGTTYLTPSGVTNLSGGADPTSMHFHIDFTAAGIDNLRQLWMTLAPPLNYSAAAGTTLAAFAPLEFAAVFSNWTLADPNGVLPLKIAGPGSVTVGSSDAWASYSGSGWAKAAGFYFRGFAYSSAHAGDVVTVQYSCQHIHNLYLGTSLGAGQGKFTVALDGLPAAHSTIDTYANTGSPIAARRLIASSVAAGTHMVSLTVSATKNAASSGYNCLLDFIQAAVLSDVHTPASTSASVNVAADYDTPQTYALAPARALWITRMMGFGGDLDFYGGVFFCHKRARVGGNFHHAVVTISAGANGFNLGTGLGDGDQIFLQVGGASYGDPLGTAFGVAVFPTDTPDTLAQRFVNAVNALFIGLRAAKTGTGEFTITGLSPVATFSFTLFSHYVFGTGSVGHYPSTGSMTITGDILTGNEGVWGIDATQTSPLNRAFSDYLADFAALVNAAGQTMTVAFSQELLAPPDVNTAAGAWGQRFVDGSQVLTSSGFGSWGAGVIEAVSGSGTVTIQQTGHGYITGNLLHAASATQSGVWPVTVVDADHYAIAVTGAYTPGVGDSTYIELQTTQCAFNGSSVTPYMANVCKQAAGILAGAGLTPWLQFGEILHWFFAQKMTVPIAAIANVGGYVQFTTSAPHGLVNGQTAIVAGAPDGTGTKTVTVIDSTHFHNGTFWAGPYAGARGTVSGGGGMAFYDASQAAAYGGSLPQFWTQDDDPTGSNAAAVAFLAGRIKTHIDSMRAAVLGAYPGAKFELLWPYDVNFPSCYYTKDLPYPQGGRLNRAVNMPAAYLSQAGSGLDRLKMEALSWGATYRHLDNAKATMTFPPPLVLGVGWPLAATAYLIPIFNGGCPWRAEFVATIRAKIPLVNLWAFDHVPLLDWTVIPLPAPARAARIS